MKKILYLFLFVSINIATVNFASADFSDVNKNTNYQKAIMWMYHAGVIDGYPDGTFKPDQCVNRAEFLKMMFKTFDVELNGNAKLFKDTYASEWYAPYIRTARAKNTIEGYPDNTFKPGQCVNRVEAVKMAILEFGNGSIPGQWGMYAQPYDVSKMSQNDWWQPYLTSALSANLVGTEYFTRFNVDYGNKEQNDFLNPRYNFGPAQSMSRKEVAEMLYRMKYAKNNNLQNYPGVNAVNYAFDACGKISAYTNKAWYAAFLEKGNISEDLALDPTRGEGCLSLDGKVFIAIIPNPGMYYSTYIAKFNTETSEFEEAVFLFNPRKADASDHTISYKYVTEFSKRVGNYIVVKGKNDFDNTTWTGKYYYLSNTVQKD